MTRKDALHVCLLWLAWVAIILSFQWLATSRLEIASADFLASANQMA
jgi:hypothetical protein